MKSKLDFTNDKLRLVVLELANLKGYEKPSTYLDELLNEVRQLNSFEFEKDFFLNVHYICKENAAKFWSEGHRKDISDWLMKARFGPTIMKPDVSVSLFSTTWENTPLQPTQPVEAKTGIESSVHPLKLSDIFESISKYQIIINYLVENQYCQPNTFNWKDSAKGNKGLLAAIIKFLHAQKYYKDNKRPTPKQIKEIAQNTFGWEISIETIKRAKPEQFDLKFIPPASTLP